MPPVPEIAPVLFAVAPAPSNVTTNLAVAIVADPVKVPAAEVIVAAEPSVMAPDQVLLLAMLRSAPPAETPVPLRVTLTDIVSPLPSTWITAPEVMLVVPALVPSA